MKNLLKLLTVILALTLSLGIFTACGHTHDYTTLKFDASGHWYECSCGEKSSTEAHKGGIATETAKAVCQVCDQEYGELGAHVHDFSKQVVSELYLKEEAKCESKAIYYFSCACGEKGTKTFEDGEALGHTYTAVVTAPKCEVRGYTTYTCECGDSYVDDYVDAIGHDYGDFVSNNNGTHSKVCANDENHVITENCTGGIAVCEDKAICEVCDTAYGNAPGHVYTRKVTPATCSEEGYTTYTCSCGESYVGNYVDATGHVYVPYVQPATCLAQGYVYRICACGEEGETEIIAQLPHEYTDWEDIGGGYAAKYCVNGCNDVIVAKLVDNKVLYSAADKSLDFDSLKAGLSDIGVEINSLDEIDGYVVNNEYVDVLELEVIINDNGTSRYGDDVVDAAQTVSFYIDNELYCCLEVYAYTKLIDEADDFDVFTLNEETAAAGIDGYFLVTKNIDASAWTFKTHKFVGGGTTYPGSRDVGFKGIFDGNGYTIDGMKIGNNGIFGQSQAPTIKNVAFTNVELSGYYCSVFTHSVSRLWEGNKVLRDYEYFNIYVEVESITLGGSKRVGILANNSLPMVGKVDNVVVEFTNFSDDENATLMKGILAGNEFGTIGGAQGTVDMSKQKVFNNVYSISKAPVYLRGRIPFFGENQVEYTAEGREVLSVGSVLDARVNKYLAVKNLTLSKSMVALGIKAYDSYTEMAASKAANAQSLATFNSEYWTVVNGVPYWKSLYADSVELVVTDNTGAIVDGNILLKDDATEYSINLYDATSKLNATITAPAGVVVNGNKIKLASKPTSIGSYEIIVSAVVNGVAIEKTLVINYSNASDINGKVLYSADDKALDMTSLNKAIADAGEETIDASDITGYIVNGVSVDELDLEVVITGIGRSRVIDTTYSVVVSFGDDAYYLHNVYAYTKVIDEAEDLKVFTLTGATEDNPYNEVDGYYIVAKNIDASALTLDAHKFMSNAIYPGNGYSADRGFVGVLDGQGYIIDGLTTLSTGLFGNTNAPIIKDIAFTNVKLTGYYPTLFAQTISRSKTPDNNFTGHDALLSNIYVSVADATAGGSGRIGILASQTLAGVVKLDNVIVDYTNVSEAVQTQIGNGKDFYMFGTTTFTMAATTAMYNNCYAISTAPVLQKASMPGFAENQVEYTLTGNKVTAVGAILDPQVNEVLTRCGKTLAVDHVIVGLKAYADYSAMAKANNDLSSFDSKYWTVSNGVAYWNGTYANQVKAVLRDAEGNKVSNVTLDSAETKLTYGFEDATHILAGAKITAPEGVKVEGNVISLASAPTGKGEYEISISIVVEGKTLTDTITIAYTNEKVIAGKVLYSAADKALDLTSLNAAGVEIESLADIDAYEVDGTPTEELELEVIVSGSGQTRVVDTAQLVKVEIDGKVYVLQNVYAYTKVIDEASDLAVFVLTGGAEGTAALSHDGYYVLGKDIDATGYTHGTHTFTSGGTTYAGSSDKGFKGVLDGNGYTISNFTSINNGLFGQATAPVVKNIAFTNVTITGYYGSLFAHAINRDGWIDGKGYTIEALFENVYIQIGKCVWGSSKRIGILANNTMPLSIRVKNVVVEYTNAKTDGVYDNVMAATHDFGIIGGSNGADMQKTLTFENVYAISDLPIMYSRGTRPYAAENQVEHTISNGYWIATVGAILDEGYADFLTAKGLTLTVNMVARDLRYYADYSAMAADSEATAEKLATIDSTYWIVVNGVPYWKSLYNGSVELVVEDKDGNATLPNDIVLKDNATEYAVKLFDATHEITNLTIAGEGLAVEGNKFKLENNPTSKGSIEVVVTATVSGVEITRTFTVAYSNEVEVEGKVLYSKDDKSLDFASLKKAFSDVDAEIISVDEIDGYIVNGVTVSELDLEVIISNDTTANYGRNRAVDTAQQVTVLMGTKAYLLNNVYAYTKLIDEAEDLNYFVIDKNNPLNEYEERDGYYLVTKNIDASELVLNDHVFMSGNVYPGNGYNTDVGLRGVFDGQGYTIKGLTAKNSGIFGQMNAGIVKNVAFTDVNLTGYYKTLFAKNFIRGKDYNNDFNYYDGMFSNVYVSVNSINNSSGNNEVGILVQGTLPGTVLIENVIIDYLNVDTSAQEKIEAGKQFYMFGSTTLTMASNTARFKNSYSISTAPVLQRTAMPGFAENQVEYTLTGSTVTAVGEILDPQVTEVLTRCGKTLTVDHVLVGLRAYDNYEAMAADTANDYSSFSSDYWTIANGVPTWNTADDEIVHEHIYSVEVTEPTCTEQGYTTYICSCGYSYVDENKYVDALGHDYSEEVTKPTCTEQGYTIYTCITCEHSYVDNYVDALGHSYENGACTVCGSTETEGIVLYSKEDKALDLPSLKVAVESVGGSITSLDEIDGYIVNSEQVDVLDLEVIISNLDTNRGMDRSVDVVQEVQVLVGEATYYINVYAYTKLIDEAEDLLYFKYDYSKNNDYPDFDGYYLVTKNIDATDLVLENHVFASAVIYPDNNDKEHGLTGVFDGNGYVISNLTTIRNGIFGCVAYAVIKDIAFTDVVVAGPSYPTLFAHSLKANTTGANTALISNVYISVKSMASKSGVMFNNAPDVNNVIYQNIVIDWQSFDNDAWLTNEDGRLGIMTDFSVAAGGYTLWNNVYAITPSPVFAVRKGAVFTVAGNLVTDNGDGTYTATDAKLQEFLTTTGKTLARNNIHFGFKSYATAEAMKADATANAESYATFSDSWIVVDGMLYWKELYKQSFELQVKQGENLVEGEIVLKDTATELTLDIVDMGGNAVASVIEAPEGVDVNGNVIKLASEPASVGAYEVKVSAVVEGLTIERWVTINYSNVIDLDGKILYSAVDKALDLPSLNTAGVEIDSLEDIDGYVVGGEEVQELELEVIISGSLNNRTVDTAQAISLKVGSKVYNLANVYAYTKLFDDLADLDWLTRQKETLEGGTLLYDAYDGMYLMTKNISGAGLGVDGADYMLAGSLSSAASKDTGLTGVFDGNGYTISNVGIPSRGLFTFIKGGVVKNLGFKDCSINGYYPVVLTHAVTNFDVDGDGKKDTPLIQNIYVEGTIIDLDYAQSGREAGILAQNNFYTYAYNVVVKHTMSEKEKENITVKRAGIILTQYYHKSGIHNNSGMNANYKDFYVISDMPLAFGFHATSTTWSHFLLAKNTVTLNEETNKWELTDSAKFALINGLLTRTYTMGGTDYTWNTSDDIVTDTIMAIDIVSTMYQYINEQDMAAAGHDYSTFDNKYWTVVDGVPTWNSLNA